VKEFGSSYVPSPRSQRRVCQGLVKIRAMRVTNLLGYHVHVLFLWLESADLAVDRVAARVRLGGHDVPEETVRRRYERGLRNFFQLYLPLLDSWQMFDNSRAGRPRLLASGRENQVQEVANAALWQEISEAYREQR